MTRSQKDEKYYSHLSNIFRFGIERRRQPLSIRALQDAVALGQEVMLLQAALMLQQAVVMLEPEAAATTTSRQLIS